MVVDDDSGVRGIVKDMLEMREHDVTPVESGVELLEILKEGEKPDLILLDIRMPELDGWETINEIKRKTPNKNIPIMILSVEELSIVKMMRKEIDDLVGYVKKEFVQSKLADTVDEAIDRLNEIEERRAKIESNAKNGEILARDYEDVNRKMMLHEKFLDKLESVTTKDNSDWDPELVQELIESEKMAMKMLKLRKMVIMKMTGGIS